MHEKFTFGVLQSSGTGHEHNKYSGFIEMGIDRKCALIVLIDDHSFKLPVTCTGEDREIFTVNQCSCVQLLAHVCLQ